MPFRLGIRDAIAAETPDAVLDALQNAVGSTVNVMTITRLRNSDPQIIWHDSVSANFRRGYQALTAEQGPPSMMFRYVATNPPPFTTTEAMHRLQPSGKDRWLFDLLRDHQMSDNLVCVIGPWVVLLDRASDAEQDGSFPADQNSTQCQCLDCRAPIEGNHGTEETSDR
jgi:hypothetical protein